jgi:putative endopeptidase
MLKSVSVAGVAALVFATYAGASVDPSAMDLTVKPQDDFYLYANGTWVKNNPVPPEFNVWGSIYIVRDQLVVDMDTCCKAAAAKGASGSPIERLVGDLYSSGIDQAAVDAAGIAPLKPELDRIAALASPADAVVEIGHLASMGVSAGFGFGSGADAKDSGMDIAQLRQGGLGLPDRDYYLKDDEKSKTLRAQYVEHVSKMLQLLGQSPDEAAAGASAVMKLETALATASLSREVLRNPYASYHKMAVADLAKFTGDLDWAAYFAATGAPAFDQVNFSHPDFFKAFAGQLHSTPAGDWQEYLRWHLVHELAANLPTAIETESFRFYGQILAGTKVERPRWKRVVTEVDGDVGEALGQLYVARFFPPQAKARMLKLVDTLMDALREDLSTLAWMDAATRAKAVAKLDAMTVKIAYPDAWRDYSALVIDRGPYVINVIRAQEFEERRELMKIGKPVDSKEWGMTPPTLNAYYRPQGNEIVFPAGILQPPMFDMSADDAANYGSIGSIIGHEMTHGFDDHGRLYDGKGNLTDWWTPESANAFKARAAVIVKQFDDFTVLDGVHVIGLRTQGENIADLGGLKIAYSAMEKALAGKPRVLIDGFTPEQRFFLSYASYWKSDIRPETLRVRILTDPHAPNPFRCNGPLSNMDEFAQAFGIPEGSPMRRPAAERVSIW